MFRRSSFAVVLWLLAVALLPVRMANAHLHLCLDGQNEPVAVHMEDVPSHHGSLYSQEGHNDVDVDVSASASTKKSETIADLARYVLGAYCVSLANPQQQRVLQPLAHPAFPIRLPLDVLPPLRGPPSLASR